jgi:cyclophilin family peptidyl-prolyl cis-trans isomerase/HEAT repeat protein
MPWLRHDYWILLALTLVGAACAPTIVPEAPAPSNVIARPSISLGETEIQGIAELLRLEDRREYDEVVFHTHLDARHPELRRYATLAAGRIRDPRAVGPLLGALNDSAAAIRAEAAFALGQIGDSAAHVVGALAARGLDPEEEPAPRIEAVAALGKLRTIEARIAIQAILDRALETGEGAPPQSVIAEALLSIWKFTRVAGMTDPIVQLSRSPDQELRWRAVYALMRLADPATVATLIDHRSDPDPLVRALAMRGLQPAVVDSSGQHGAAVAALAEATRDPHPHVRVNALRALASFRLPEQTGTLARGLRDPEINVALTAAEALGQGGEPAIAALETVAADPGTRIALRAAALASLLRIASEHGDSIATELARSGDWLTRLYAARALAAAPEDRGLSLLTELAHDPDPRVAATALGGLAALGPERAPGLDRLFIEQLGSADTGIRAAAIRGLTDRVTAADLPVLLDAYDRAEHDSDINDAARAAVAALGALASKGVPVQRAFFRRFARSPDPIIRREVQEQLGPGLWGEPYPIETDRDLAFYEEIVHTLVAPDLAGAPRPRALIHTASGEISIELAAADAPLTVHNFMTLAGRGYFDGFRWHRVVPNFVLQVGDPRGDGAGGPGYAIRDEINRIRYLRGTVGMALGGADTGGSQFFITHAPQPHLDGGYTIFGRVVAGIDAADQVVQDDRIHRIEITRSTTSALAPLTPEW